MPFRATIEKYHAATGEYWTNVYWLDVASVGDGLTKAEMIAAAERDFHHTSVTFTKVRCDDAFPGTDSYATSVINLPGLLTLAGQLLPLFNVIRADFSVAGGGRPSRKFYRGCLAEDIVTVNAIDASSVPTFNGHIDDLLAIGGIVDPDNQAWTGVAIWPFVGMRQLRRGSKKKDTQSPPSTP